MSIELKTILLTDQNNNYISSANLDSWINAHPTTLKVLKSASLILGIGLMTSLPYTISILAAKHSIGLALTGSILTLLSSISLFPIKKNINLHVIDNPENPIKHEITTPQNRKIPPIGISDTIIVIDGEIVSAHGTGELFSDNEIIEKLDIVKEEDIGHGIYAKYTKYGKAIIQQQATRGCTAATAAMIIKDHGKQPDIKKLRFRNLGNTENQISDIRKAGLTPIVNSAYVLSDLRTLLIKNGSAIVEISGKLGGHVIVVDHISEDLSQVRLRDPYHGWEITVTRIAFLKEWLGGAAIQVLK